MEKELKKRLDEFSDDRFIEYINRLAELGIDSGEYRETGQIIYFLPDIHKLVNEIRNNQNN